ncbi:hypothetical protein GQ53DRAFT_102717 [Thozetella sp. PMI_491]|nr:hypothetical protein GQ53DRAFT_102717 [Thozetella sp. PMI_491]
MAPHLQYAQTEHRPSFNMGSQVSHAPESPGSTALEGHSRPMEASAHSHRTYQDLIHSIPGLGHGTSFVPSSEDGFPQNYPLLKFYTDRDGPWIPLSKSGADARSDDPRGRAQPLGLSFGNGAAMFNNYRDPVSSECDTIPPGVLLSDSGYGSLPKASVGTQSLYGGDVDRNLETQSMISHATDFNLHQGLAKLSWGQQSVTHSQAGGADRLVCSTCHRMVKNKSELNKHYLRHTKPHQCDISGCNRKEGFSTKNDLMRHKESVHKTVGKKYSCNIGVCRDKEKIWPRADNFRSHLKRVHNRIITADDDELKTFIYSPASHEDNSLDYSPPVAADAEDPALPSSNWAGMELRPEDAMSLGDGPSQDRLSPMETRLAFSGEDHAMHDGSFPLGSDSGDQDDDHDGSIGLLPEDSLQFDHMVPTTRPRNSRSPSHEEAATPDLSCIRPDVLNHTSFSQELHDGSDNRPQVIDLVSDESVAATPRGADDDCDEESPAPEETNEPHEPSKLEPAIRVDALKQEGSFSSDTQPSTPEEGSLEVDSLEVEDLSSSCPSKASEDNDTAQESVLPEPKSLVDKLEDINLDDEEKTRNILEGLQARGVLEKMMERLGYQKAKDQAPKPKKGAVHPAQNDNHPNNQVACTECPKSFNRQCELKKHMKRHAKPYGCTFLGCSKRFGSKNDWKRHENSQHFQLEVWKCEELTGDGTKQRCGKVCHRRETFKHHLDKDHSITDLKAVDKTLEASRIGRTCESRFWCGFCERKIEATPDGKPAFAQRFDHIDDHLFGRSGPKKQISEWKNVDPEAQDKTDTASSEAESSPSTPESSHSAKMERKRGRDHSGDAEPSPKRAKIRTVWFCCSCQIQNTFAINASCSGPTCSHLYCDSCRAESTGHHDEGEDDQPMA